MEQAKLYNIIDIVADSYRISLLQSKFEELGLLPLHEVRSGPATHAKVAPLIESMFAEEKLILATTRLCDGTSTTHQELDAKGNTTTKRLSLEPQDRRILCFECTLSKDSELQEVQNNIMMLDVYTY